MDYSWINLPRHTNEFKRALNAYLDYSFSKDGVGEQILCPCKSCKTRFWHDRQQVFDHLVVEGFVRGFKEWVSQREELSSTPNIRQTNGDKSQTCDNIDGLLHDTYKNVVEASDGCEGVKQGPNEEARKFYKLVEDGKQELYPGCTTFSKLSFIIRLYLFKSLNGLSNVAFSDLLDLLREAFPMANFPKSYAEARNVVKDLGLDYKKIHACPNDCMLFWKDNAGADFCHKCQASRWKSDKVPAKVLRHFPLKPRLQRLFMCSETAEFMTWHHTECPNDGKIRHPADGEAWKTFDSKYSFFSKDPRNVRLALATDGFNPFRTMSVAHSTWPIVLINYNLPPWLSTKPEYFMLSLLVPGPTSPGNNIDIYMQPLIDELKDLWDVGLETYDASTNTSFNMHAALLSTISDFPGYSMVSGWRTKGNLACPSCNFDARPHYLHHSKKNCYMGHRRFLVSTHPWRQDDTSFNEGIEDRDPPVPLSGIEVLRQLENVANDFGLKKDCGNKHGPWKKKSELFQLPYWHDTSRHNLDVMHIEKNVFDNLIGTLLDIPGKTKDHLNARFDLVNLGIKEHLHPFPSDDGKKLLLPPASFTMTNGEKDVFLKVLKEAKLPYGYASNIARCVQEKERRFAGYKTHDAHVLLHHLLQVAVRKTLSKDVAVPLIKLGNFFRRICIKVISFKELDDLGDEVAEILCELERIFPPAFFDIMVHLPVHLVDEIKLGGPVQYRWMYFVERYLCTLKSYVRNRSRPEGCIAEGWLLQECLTFCSRYLHNGVKTKLDRRSAWNLRSDTEDQASIFPKVGFPIGRGKNKINGKGFCLDFQTLKQAHRYIIFNSGSETVDTYIKEHKELVNNRGRNRRWDKARSHSSEFIDWFQDKVQNEQVADDIFWLAKGPNPKARRFSGYFVNGYKFCTIERDSCLKTQNSGVTLGAWTTSFSSSKDQNPVENDVTYYGRIEEIIEVDFWSKFSVVLFRCDWYLADIDDFGLTRVNFKKKCFRDDPFVMASQVHQVFYVQDPEEHDIHYVMKRVPRDLFDFSETPSSKSYWEETIDVDSGNVGCSSADVTHPRDRVGDRVIDIEEVLNASQFEEPEEDSDYDDTDWDWMDASDS